MFVSLVAGAATAVFVVVVDVNISPLFIANVRNHYLLLQGKEGEGLAYYYIT